jgi:hypothetical protein
VRNAFLICATTVMLGLACSKKSATNEEPLARVNNKYLNPSDVQDLFYANTGEADSARILQVYIDNWIKNQLLADIAEKQLNEKEKNVARELDEYRNSLLIHRYQSRLLQERLDTLVTEEELLAYFEKNKNNFELAKNIVQLKFIKIDRKASILPELRRLFLSPDLKSKKELASLCEKHAANFFLDDEAWLDFSEVQKELPIKQYDEEHFLRNNKFLEINEGRYIYLILIIAYRTKNTLSSFEFEKERIKSVVINQRKSDLLKRFEQSMIEKAKEKKEIQNYTIQ